MHRLKHPFLETAHDNHGTAAFEGLAALGHDAIANEIDVTTIAEGPYACVLWTDERGIVFGHDGQLDMLRIGVDTLSDEHIVEAVGVVEAFYQIGDGVRCDIGAVAFFAETPAEFVTVAGLVDAALALLPVAVFIDIPGVLVVILAACLISYREVAQLAAVEVADDDIALRAFPVDIHLAGLGDMGITVTAPHHADVEPL